MKKVAKYLAIGGLAGCVELAVCLYLAFQAKIGTFEDVAFFAGLFTLLLGIVMLFRTVRVHGGSMGFPSNSNAQTAMNAQIAFDEARLMSQQNPSGIRSRAGFPLGSMAVLTAAMVVWIGFVVGLFVA